jgi:hypothetical protein
MSDKICDRVDQCRTGNINLPHDYRCRAGTRTSLSGRCHSAVKAYVRPRRTFTVVEVDRDALGMVCQGQKLFVMADTDNTRRPVHTELSKRLPCIRLATVLPSSRTFTTKFLPRFGSLETIRRPTDRAAAVPVETAYIRARIRTNRDVEMYFAFIFHFITLGTRFLDVWIALSRLRWRFRAKLLTRDPVKTICQRKSTGG